MSSRYTLLKYITFSLKIIKLPTNLCANIKKLCLYTYGYNVPKLRYGHLFLNIKMCTGTSSHKITHV